MHRGAACMPIGFFTNSFQIYLSLPSRPCNQQINQEDTFLLHPRAARILNQFELSKFSVLNAETELRVVIAACSQRRRTPSCQKCRTFETLGAFLSEREEISKLFVHTEIT